ncbi:hypothetical protein [Methanobacterium congolense]|jgi:hypothetical protein|uniref:Uncharacterized protein n=1 Tax=Methanobacterium congolense TaxID=118062 RepID=A0A1D3L512_9EURY|nr:hypothetical protein [Methanobacterium congolense]SCG86599.1 putative protein [Methanobacterium congolense]
MIKMEKTCGSLKCDVLHDGAKIGHMDGVNIIQWFVKNRYRYTGTFSRFITENPSDSQSGIDVDIVLSDKNLVIRNARVEWMKSPCKNGTFHADKIESRA